MRVRLLMDDEAEQFFKDALELFGLPSQVGLVNEECAELIVALNHVIRGKAELKDVASELADVSVMLGQLLLVINHEKVNEIIDQKLTRAANKIAKYKANGGTRYEDGYSRYTESSGCKKVDDS